MKYKNAGDAANTNWLKYFLLAKPIINIKVIAILSDNALGSTVVVYCMVCGGLVGA